MSNGESCRKKLPVEAVCSICLRYVLDPVTLVCDHVFCQVCILKCWKESPAEDSCPQCHKAASQQNQQLSPENQQVNYLAQLFKHLSTERREEPDGSSQACENQPGLTELNCEDSQAVVSSECGSSMAFQAQFMVPAGKDAPELKDQLLYHLEILKKEKGELLVYRLNIEKEGRNLVNRIEMEQEKVDAEFKLLRQFLEENENHLLCGMETLKEEIKSCWKKQTMKLARQFSSLEKIIIELEQKHEQPTVELLKKAATILERVARKEKFESQAIFPPLLKWELWEMCDLSAVLVSAMQQFKDTVKSGCQLKKANVTLDPDTAHPKLILSVDCKSLTLGDIPQHLNNYWKRFDQCFFVLGREEFTAGRHYWDVIVGKEDGWGVGVVRSSVQRKGIVSLQPAEGVWAVAKWGDRCMVLISPHFPSLTVSSEFSKIRISLNYAGRRVAFLNADTGALIWAFTETEFFGEPLCPFFWLQRKTQLSLSP